MFEKFSSSESVQLLTFDTVRLATGLDWQEVNLDSDPTIPVEDGVYAWVGSDAPHTLRYHGKAEAAGGLRRRVTELLGYRNDQLDLLAVGPAELTEAQAFKIARESPEIQQSANNARLFYAIARPASWTIKRNEHQPPSTAKEWVEFINSLGLIVTSNRGLFGKGAWSDKQPHHMAMTDLAWDRLVDLNGGTWT